MRRAKVTNYEVFIIAALMCVALSFVYLFFVEWFGKVLIYICVAVLAVAPAAMGGYCLYQAVQGEESDYGKKVASFNLGVTGTQGDMILGAAGKMHAKSGGTMKIMKDLHDVLMLS